MSDDSLKCDCRWILAPGYCGAVATIEVNNGKRIQDGGNDAPPLEEAKANNLFIAHARTDLPRFEKALRAVLDAARKDGHIYAGEVDNIITAALEVEADALEVEAEPCPRCNGTGCIDAPFSDSDPCCPECDGEGKR